MLGDGRSPGGAFAGVVDIDGAEDGPRVYAVVLLKRLVFNSYGSFDERIGHLVYVDVGALARAMVEHLVQQRAVTVIDARRFELDRVNIIYRGQVLRVISVGDGPRYTDRNCCTNEQKPERAEQRKRPYHRARQTPRFLQVRERVIATAPVFPAGSAPAPGSAQDKQGTPTMDAPPPRTCSNQRRCKGLIFRAGPCGCDLKVGGLDARPGPAVLLFLRGSGSSNSR